MRTTSKPVPAVWSVGQARIMQKSYFGRVECRVGGDSSSGSALTKTLAPSPGRDRVALIRDSAEIRCMSLIMKVER